MPVNKTINNFIENKYAVTIPLALMIGVYLAIVLSITAMRQSALMSGSMDQAAYTQAIWKVANGKMPFQTIYNTNLFFGEHFIPLGFIFGYLFRLIPSINFLFVLESLSLALGAIPLFLIAKKELNSMGWSLVVAFLYLSYYPLYATDLFDFSPEKFSILFLLLAFYFLNIRKHFISLIFIILSLCVKEYYAFAIGLLGLFALFKYRERTWGIAITSIAIFWIVFSYGIIIPKYGSDIMQINWSEYYPFAGESIVQGVIYLLTHPGLIISKIFRPAVGAYFINLFLPVVFLPLAGIEYLVPAIPMFAINILSEDSIHALSVNQQYHIMIIPFLFISLIFGLKRMRSCLTNHRWVGKNLLPIFVCLVVVVNFGNYRYILYRVKQAHQLMSEYKDHGEIVRSAILKIPKDARVVSNYSLTPYLAQRDYIYGHFTFDQDFKFNRFYISERNWLRENKIDYIIFDTRYKFHWDDDLNKKRDEKLLYLNSLKEYEQLFDRDGLIIFKAKK